MAVLSLAGLHYTYPGTADRALDGVDLEIGPGLTLLTGASGSGKSTLLRVCNGLIPHFHGGVIGGSARVQGRDVFRTPTRELARDVGFVFQDPELQAVYPTVERDAAFGLENLGVPRGEMLRRVGDALEICGITHLRSRAVGTLSGGERQRLALAGVLAMRPCLLVLDEPFSQLDPAGSAALLSALEAAVRSGTTALVSEHRHHLVRQRADRCLVMGRGRVTACAPDVPVEAASRAVSRGAGVTPQLSWCLHRVSAGPAGVAVLHDLDLAGGAGEVVALTGANGSGKTTLLRTIAGLLSPLSGSVERRPGRIAYLPQNPSALLHRATVRSEIAWTLRRTGSAGRADAALEELGLTAVADRDPRDLSTGQRQRAALASVLAGDPSLVLLDEPTRGMDAAARAALTAAVARIAERGGSAVVATHDLQLVAAVATRVVDLMDGRACERPALATVAR
ncbi:MAG: ATP-binding cassette domain-containing protein [Candidatus Dormibacteria bacterium]|jgi:energy-coupling factor transport system ATP-binding protein